MSYKKSCRNGDNCKYYKEGRCLYSHTEYRPLKRLNNLDNIEYVDISLRDTLKNFAVEIMTEEEYQKFSFLCDFREAENILKTFLSNQSK